MLKLKLKSNQSKAKLSARVYGIPTTQISPIYHKVQGFAGCPIMGQQFRVLSKCLRNDFAKDDLSYRVD